MKVDVIQELMNEAYDKWQKGWSRSDFLEYVKKNLSEEHYIAVIFGNLNYQVENGGFNQWDFNGYSEDLDDLLYYIKEIPGEESKTVEDLLLEFKKCKEDRDNKMHASDYNLPYELHDHLYEIQELIREEFHLLIRDLDDAYYEVNEKFLENLNKYLERRLKHGNSSRSRKNG